MGVISYQPASSGAAAQVTAAAAADLRVRQGVDVLTQIITRPDGSVSTAVVTLGDSSPATTTLSSVPTATLTQSASGTSAPYVGAGANTSLSQAAIGGILGAIVGLVVFVLVVYCCINMNGRGGGSRWGGSSRWSSSGSSYSSSSTSYGSSKSSKSSRSSSGSSSTSESELRREKRRSRRARTRAAAVRPTTTRVVRDSGLTLNPPPGNIPPRAPPPTYRATRTVQFGGVSRYP